jgi:hypothetical protein
MGFGADEAEHAMKSALDDPELALAILKYVCARFIFVIIKCLLMSDVHGMYW